MARKMEVAERIPGGVAKGPPCRIEDLVFACPDLTWNQIFLEVDRLSRAGKLVLSLQERAGIFRIRGCRGVVPTPRESRQRGNPGPWVTVSAQG